MRCAPAILIFSVFASAQAPSPTFDVASVKPSPPSATDLLNINLGTLSHGVVTLDNTTLSECIRYAYGLVSEEQIDGPDWIHDRSLRVDINAKTAPDAPVEQVRLMMQNLLAERFHPVMHHTPKPVRHYEVTVARGGSKLPVSPEGGPSVRVDYRPGRLFYDRLPIRTLAVLLSRQLKEPVLDLTSLDGFYNVRLEWRPDDLSEKGAQLSDALRGNAAPLPDLFHAAEQQIGLHIEEKKTPIDVLVIDHADKVPVAN